MTTATMDETENKTQAHPLIKYSIADAKIAELREQYLTLTINGIEDKVGYAAVRKARLEIRGLRADVENTRKDLKADALEYGRKVDGEAKRITALLEEIEEPLHEREKAIDEEKAAIEAAAQAARDKRNRARYDALSAVGVVVDIDEMGKIVVLTDEEFEARLARETEAYELRVMQEEHDAAEFARLKAEEDARIAAKAEEDRLAREAEDKRLADQRAEQDARARELADKEAALKAEADRLAAQKREADHAAEVKAAAEAAAETARKEAEAKAAQDAKDAADRAEREHIAAEKAAAMAPDKEKALAYLDGLRKVPVPAMATEEGKAVMARFLTSMKSAAAIIAELAKA